MGDNEAKWYANLNDLLDDNNKNMSGWDLDILLDHIKNAASDFIEKETSHKPHFKAELVADLTDEHIDMLQGAIGLSDGNRYSYWRTVFIHINLRFAGNDDACSTAQDIATRLKYLPKAVPRAPVFLLLAEAYLSHKDKAEIVTHGRLLATSSEARKNELAAALRAIDEVLHSGNIPKTRHRQAAGVNVVKAVFGLLSIFNTYNPNKRNPPIIRGCLMDLRISIDPAKIRHWRRAKTTTRVGHLNLDAMNRNQKKLLVAAACVIALMGVFPPWTAESHFSTTGGPPMYTSVGYHFIFTHPGDEFDPEALDLEIPGQDPYAGLTPHERSMEAYKDWVESAPDFEGQFRDAQENIPEMTPEQIETMIDKGSIIVGGETYIRMDRKTWRVPEQLKPNPETGLWDPDVPYPELILEEGTEGTNLSGTGANSPLPGIGLPGSEEYIEGGKTYLPLIWKDGKLQSQYAGRPGGQKSVTLTSKKTVSIDTNRLLVQWVSVCIITTLLCLVLANKKERPKDPAEPPDVRKNRGTPK